MKRLALNFRCSHALLLSFFAAFTAPLTAATYYWDTNPTTATIGNGTLDGGAGTWDTTLANFTTSSTDDVAVSHNIWSSALMSLGKDTVIFGGAAGGAVTLNTFANGGQISSSTTAAVNTLSFTTDGYVLGGSGQFRFVNNGAVGGTISVASGITATINNAIQGTTAGGLSSTTTNADGAVDTLVDITGGGTLRLGGGNGSLGFNITGNTTVEVTAGSFSGFNLSTIGTGSTLRTNANNVLPTPSSLTGGGTYDLNGFSNITSTVGGTMSVTNSTSTASTTLNLSLSNSTAVNTGVISNGAGKTSVSTIGILAQGNNFSSSSSFASQTFAGSNTYTGSTSHGRGTLALDFSNAAAPLSNILYNGVSLGSLSGDDGKLILTRPLGTTATGQAGGMASSLTTFNVIGKAAIANSQAFSGFRLDAGAASQFNVNPGNGGTLAIDLGTSLDRAAGSFVNFATGSTVTGTSTAFTANSLTFDPAVAANFAVGMGISGTGMTSGTITAVNYTTGVVTLSSAVTASGNVATGVGNVSTQLSGNATVSTTAGTANTLITDASGTAFVIIGNRDWAAKNSTNTAIVPVGSATTTAAYTTSTPSSLTGIATTPTAGGAGNDIRLGGDTSISALRFANSGGRTGINLGGNTLTTGGILLNPSVANSGSTIGGGTIKPAGSDLVIINNSGSSRYFGISAALADGAAGTTGLTTGGTNSLLLTGNNTFTGSIDVGQNGVVLTGTNTPSAINLNGSTVAGMGNQLPGTSPTATFLQIGNAGTSGSIGSAPVNVGINAFLAVKRSDAYTVNSNITGLGGLTQGWSGTTTLLSAAAAKYTYAGDTAVTAGSLKLDYAASNTGILPDQTRLVLGGGAVEYATASGTTHNDAVRDTILLSGASTITKTGSGTGRLRLNGINTQATAGSTLNFTAAGIADTDTSNTAGILGSAGRFTVGSAGSYDWAFSATSGAADTSITAFSPSTALTTANGNNLQALTGTVSLAANLTANSLKLTNASGSSQILDIGAPQTLTLTSGGLLVTGTNEVQINNGTLKSATATNSDLIIHQYNSGGLTIGSTIANGTGNSTLTKTGDGLLTLGGTNTYTGQTFLNGGVTSISANANLGAVATGAALIINNGTLKSTATVILSNGAVGTNNRAITLNGVGGTFEVDSGTTLTIGGAITGPGGLTKTGAGTLDLRSNSYTGPTTITAGTLKLGAAINNIYSGYTVGAAGTLDIGGFGNAVGALEGSGIVTNTGNAASFSFGAFSTDTTFSGQFNQGANALTFEKYGSGTFTLTSGTHSFTGTAIISGGVFALSGAGALPDANQVNVNSAAGTFDISGISATGETIGSLAGVAGSSVVLGSKDLTLGGTGSTTFAGIIGGSGGLISNRSASTTQTLSGANTYTGLTTITQGILSITNNSALGGTGVGSGTIINSNGTTTTGGQLNLDGGVTTGENITIQGTGDGGSFQRAISSGTGINTSNGTITLTGTNSFRIGSGGTSTLNLGLIQRSTASGGSITFDPSAGSTTIITQAIDNNLGNITLHAGGTVVFNATANDIGDVTIQNSTTGRVAIADAFNTVRNVTIGVSGLVNGNTGAGNDVGTLQLAGVDQTINALNGYANAGPAVNNASTDDKRKVTNTVAATTATLTVGNGNGSGTFTGVIEDGAGKIALIKLGSGTQNINGTVASTYTGTTTVSGGRLNLNGTIGGDTVTVASTGTLGGSGVIGAGVPGSTLEINGTLAPGTSPGIITSNKPVDFNAGSVFSIELNGSTVATGYDQLAATNGISINATSVFSLTLGYAPDVSDTFLVIDNQAATPIVGSFSNLAEGGTINASFASTTYTFSATYAGGTGGNDLVLSVVPEASSSLLILGSSLALLNRRRRR